MPEEPTLGEVDRRLAAVHQDLKDDFRDLAKRLDDKVSMERYQLEQQARDTAMQLLAERIKGVEDERAAEARQRETDRRAVEAQRRADKRWIISAVLLPVALFLFQAYLSAKGAS